MLRERKLDLVIGRVMSSIFGDDLTSEFLCNERMYVVAGTTSRGVAYTYAFLNTFPASLGHSPQGGCHLRAHSIIGSARPRRMQACAGRGSPSHQRVHARLSTRYART